MRRWWVALDEHFNSDAIAQRGGAQCDQSQLPGLRWVGIANPLEVVVSRDAIEEQGHRLIRGRASVHVRLLSTQRSA
jgi:hypothetical protein